MGEDRGSKDSGSNQGDRGKTDGEGNLLERGKEKSLLVKIPTYGSPHVKKGGEGGVAGLE